VINAKLFLEVLIRLFAVLSGLDFHGKLFEAYIWRQIRHIVFLLPCRPALVDKPNLLARHALHTLITHKMFVTVRNANMSSCEQTCKPTFRSPPLTDPLPFLVSQRLLSGYGRMFSDMIYARPSRLCGRKHRGDIGRVDGLTP
jgi:hypothetical protein